MMKKELHRIIILGDAGRGKSTLAARLSEKLGIPFYSTDDFLYERKFTKWRDKEESIKMIEDVYRKDKWIVEGTTRHLLEPGLDSADVIIYLRYKNIFTQWIRLAHRYFLRKERNLKRLLGLMKHVFYKRYGLGYKKGQPTIADILIPYADKTITLSSFREAEVFLASIH